MSQISNELNYDREVIRVWFCNKRQALKNTVRRIHDVTQGSGSSTQGLLEDQTGFQRDTPTIQEEIGDIY
ncbi:POU domain, class 6, transcription factor 2 [Cichlidogyrus casuarinus]|uniref:POU domain, class 6, transcription factor 2 n=1 Tax=Cichlidogyrus casuarinus TaxID=1844966 RepID=A0ABD2PPX3_9PLAT